MDSKTNLPNPGTRSSKSSPTRSRSQRKLTSVELTPSVVIQKIVQHSRDPSSPRFLKYLVYLKKSFSSSNLKLWMDLRTKGGINAIETVIKSYANENQEGSISKFPPSCTDSCSSTIKQDVLTSILSILGNAYSLDYSARKDVASSGFIAVLHVLIKCGTSSGEDFQGSNLTDVASRPKEAQEPPFSPAECEIKTKTVKCIANLAFDTNCRDVILKSGVGITILKLLETFNRYWNETKLPQEEDPDKTTLTSSSAVEEFSECARASVRAIRILSSESRCEDAKSHLIRFGAVSTVGQILKWTVHDDLKLDVIRSLVNLTDKIRLLPSEQVRELVSEDKENPILKDLINVLDACSVDAKWFLPTIRCLINFSGNTRIAETMGRHFVFRVALNKLGQTPEIYYTEICRLLLTLTKHCEVNKCRLYNCHEMWTTLQILRCDGPQEYHRWLLQVYENVYEGTLKSLLRNGLIQLIHEHFKKELEDCDYEILNHKILSLDETICKVHGELCQFIPTYRCDSPSYQQVQQETRSFTKDRDLLFKMEVDSGSSGIDSSSSPSSSPTRSWSSDDSGSELGLNNRSNSPVSSSDDEGCYSPVYGSLLLSPTYSEGSPSETSFSPDRSWHETIEHRQTKCPRLDSMSHIPFLNEDHSTKKTDSIKNKSKKIVVMLNILQKVSFLSPMPEAMADIVPILLSFIIRGIVSLTPQKLKYQDHSLTAEMTRELLLIGRRSFCLAYRILKSLCLNINFFPEMVKNGTISIVSRLLPWDKTLTNSGNAETITALLDALRGITNDTSGWREGHLMRTLLISKSDEELTKASLTIPLLFRRNDHTLRNFESKGSSWTRVFDLLVKNQDLRPSLFQDCILTLSALSETIGMKYDISDTNRRPKLWTSNDAQDIDNVLQFLDDPNSPDMTNFENDGKVKITLDDGSSALILKSVLTEASPVFSAMFDGHFKEAGSQTVLIRSVSRETLKVVIQQLQIQTNLELLNNPISNNLELSTLFELISLSDQFLLDTIYERTINTLLACYICPHSAPRIYQQAQKLSVLWKPQSRLQGWDMDITFVILKYLLVGDMTFSSRCDAFRNIFDASPSEAVVGDMRALVEFYNTRPQNR